MSDELQELHYRIAHAHEGDPEDRRRRYRVIAELVQAGEVVVDIGSGPGIFLELVRERGARGIGIDVDPTMVAVARGRGFEVHLERAQELEWSWGRTDFVSLIHIVEHLSPTDLLPILLKARRSLSDRGRMFILTPNIDHPRVQSRFWLDLTHERPYPGELLATTLAELGFRHVQWGHMAHGLDTWCYGYQDPADRVMRRRVPVLHRSARRQVLLTGLQIEGERSAGADAPAY